MRFALYKDYNFPKNFPGGEFQKRVADFTPHIMEPLLKGKQMFNRAIQVKMVKPNKDEAQQTVQPELQFEKKVAIVAGYSELLINKVAGAAVTYILLDTIRKVLVAKASK